MEENISTNKETLVIGRKVEQEAERPKTITLANLRKEEENINNNSDYKDFASYTKAKEKSTREDKDTNKFVDTLLEKQTNIEKGNFKLKKNINKDIENKKENSIEEVALLLKDNRIDQIIVAGERKPDQKYLKENPKSKEKIFTLKPDLDTLTALYLLNNFNKKTTEETYNEGSVTSVIEKGGEGKDLVEDKNGVKIFLDAGGNWLEVKKDNDTTTIYIDHHGVGQRDPTSGTKMMMEIMEKADMLKEKPEWLVKFVNFVNDIDNLSYLDKKDDKGRKVFTENYFRNEWPNSLYALAEKQIPFKELIELCESEKIKDPSIPLSTKEMGGEIGNIKIGDNTIRELCMQQKKQVEKVLDGVKNSIINNKKRNLNLETESLGKIVYQDYFKIKGKVNTIPDHLAFKAIKAKGFDTYISWNKQKGSFFLNSSNPNLSKIVEKLNKIDPGCAIDVRGVMVFGEIKNLTEEQFLNIIDLKILENETKETQKALSEQGEEKNENKNIENDEWTKEDEKTLANLLKVIEETKKELAELDILEIEINNEKK